MMACDDIQPGDVVLRTPPSIIINRESILSHLQNSDDAVDKDLHKLIQYVWFVTSNFEGTF